MHKNVIYSVSFSPDSRILASAGEDETIHILDVETGKHVKTFYSPRIYDRMNITGVKGLTDAEISTLKALGAVENGEI
jgi:WD40 repeat protein